MARLIRLTDDNSKPFWLNVDKIVTVAANTDAVGITRTTILHEPWDYSAGNLGWAEVQESPEDIAVMVNEPREITGSVEIAGQSFIKVREA